MHNILFINPAGGIGGAEKSLIDLVTRLPRERFHPLVVILGPGPLARELFDRGVEIREVHLPSALLGLSRKDRFNLILLLLSGPFHLPSVIGHLIKLIREERIALVHTNGIKAHLIALLPALLSRRPLVWHFRDLPGRGGYGILFRSLARILPTRIIANSQAVKRALKSPLRTRVVYNGVDPFPVGAGYSRSSARRMLGLEEDEIAIGTIGHLAPLKGYEDFLAAMPSVLKQVPSARFVITGEALYPAWRDYHRKLETEAVRLGLSEKVNFTGGRKDPGEILPALDIFVLPSRSEGFGRANLEAMAAGLPVVSTDVGGIPEVVADGVTGILVSPQRPAALARAIITLARDSGLRTEMGKAGRQRAADFSIKKMVNGVISCYGEIL